MDAEREYCFAHLAYRGAGGDRCVTALDHQVATPCEWTEEPLPCSGCGTSTPDDLRSHTWGCEVAREMAWDAREDHALGADRGK